MQRTLQRTADWPTLSGSRVARPDLVEAAAAGTRSGQRTGGPLPAIGLGMAVMYGLLAAFGVVAEPLESFALACVATSAGLVVISRAHYTSRLGKSFTVIVLVVFVVKISIGVAHYLLFFEPDYFAQPLGFFPWIFDYAQLPEGMQNISESWHTYGFAAVPRTQSVEKSLILSVYHALLYYLGGNQFLNFVPWASFHTLLVGFLVTSLALQHGSTRRQAVAAFALASLQPLFLYTDLPQRDVVGQFFVVLASYLLVRSLGKAQQLMFAFPAALVLVYAQRWAYPWIIAAYLLVAYLLVRKKIAVALGLAGALTLVFWLAGPLLTEMTLGHYSTEAPMAPINRLPQAIAVGVIGPFPWTQVFEVEDAFVHLPPSFLQAWLGMIIWMIVLPRLWRQWRATHTLDDSALMALLFTLSGMLTVATHTGYVHIATVLLLPIACKAPVVEWGRKAVVVSYLYLFGHLLFYGLGLQGQSQFLR